MALYVQHEESFRRRKISGSTNFHNSLGKKGTEECKKFSKRTYLIFRIPQNFVVDMLTIITDQAIRKMRYALSLGDFIAYKWRPALSEGTNCARDE